MSSLGSPSPFFLAGKKAYQVERSLRFNTTDQTEVTNTSLGTSPTNRKILTVSLWFKRSSLSASETGLITYGYSGSGGSQSNSGLRFVNSDVNLSINNEVNNSTAWSLVTSRVFKDFSAWYHIVVAIDTTQSTASDRVKVYINGIQETSFSTANYPSQNYDSLWLYSNVRIGASDGGGSYYAGWNGYIAEYNAIDGQALTPASFGETDATTGQWNPIKYTGSYGTNGHYLNFSDNSGTTATTLGKDSSGNGNNFTPNNFSVSAGAGNDSLEDSPTNNFCTLNPLSFGGTFSNGNLDHVTGTNSGRRFLGSFGVSSGKWYWETTVNNLAAGLMIGIGNTTDYANNNTFIGHQSGTYGWYSFTSNSEKYYNGSSASYGTAFTAGQTIGLALDLDSGTLTFYANDGSSVGVLQSSLPSATYFPIFGDGSSSNTSSVSVNFGQRAFTHSIPTGHKALNSANLPDPTILLPNKHFNTLLYTGNGSTQSISGLNFQPDWVWIKQRNAAENHFLTDSRRGAGLHLRSDQTTAESDDSATFTAFTSDGFSLTGSGAAAPQVNDNSDTYVAWNWNAGDTDGKTYTVKVVSDGGNKYRFDDFGTSAVTLDLAEGGTYIFDGADSSMASHPIKLSETSNGTHGGGSSYNTGVTYLLDGASVTESAYVSGYSSATTRQLKIVVAASAPTLYYYCHYHSGMGGAINTNSTLGSSNFDGSIQTTVKVNATAGFSIITYTGNGSNGSTIGHGLGVTPNHVIWKERSGAENWINWQTQLAGNALLLNLSNAQISASGNNLFIYGDFNSTSLKLGNADQTNRNGDTYVSYCFSEVAGYSKFGTYTGNGSTAGDGPFVFCGFRPAFVIIKMSSHTGNWFMMDNKRDPFNFCSRRLFPNKSNAEGSSHNVISMLSNGFKIEDDYDGAWNYNGRTFIFLAFAESPFKNARAR